MSSGVAFDSGSSGKAYQIPSSRCSLSHKPPPYWIGALQSTHVLTRLEIHLANTLILTRSSSAACASSSVCSGDADSVIPLIGTRQLVGTVAKELKLTSTSPYRVWLQGQQVSAQSNNLELVHRKYTIQNSVVHEQQTFFFDDISDSLLKQF